MSKNGTFRQIGGTLYLLTPRDYVVQIPHDGTASTTATGIVQIDPSSPFLLFDRHISDTTDPSTAAPGLAGQYENLVQVQDTSSNYNWSNDFVWRSGFARDREHGYRMPEECMIAANTRLLVTIKNPTVAPAAGTSTVTLQGYSLYPYSK